MLLDFLFNALESVFPSGCFYSDFQFKTRSTNTNKNTLKQTWQMNHDVHETWPSASLKRLNKAAE